MTQQCPKPFPIYLFHLNCDKTRELTICFNPQRPPFPRACINVVPIEFEQHAKLLGLTFNSSLTWKDHIEELVTKSYPKHSFHVQRALECVTLLRVL